MRRQHQNHHLFTEPESDSADMLSAPLTGVFTGLRKSHSKKCPETTEPKDIASQCHGGPLFLYFSSTNTTWIVESDEILRSIVTRRMEGDPRSQTFLADLYDGENKQPDFLRANAVVDLSSVFGICGSDLLSSVTVFKLPDNYDQSISRTIHSPHQCAIQFMVNDAKLLIGYQMDSTIQGHRFLTWDDVRADFPKHHLSVCLLVEK